MKLLLPILIFFIMTAFTACPGTAGGVNLSSSAVGGGSSSSVMPVQQPDYTLPDSPNVTTSFVVQTTAAGDKLAKYSALSFGNSSASAGPVVSNEMPAAVMNAVALSGTAGLSCDGDTSTRWESTHNVDPQWIYWDLGSGKVLRKIIIDWETASASNYTIDVSQDASAWTTQVTVTNSGTANHTVITNVLSGTYRYVRMYGTVRSTVYGYSIWEANIIIYDADSSSGGITVNIDTGNLRQTIDGIGGALTESSAFVLACLPASLKNQIMDSNYTAAGADYTIARTHIGACDFSPAGKYSYDDVSGDTSLSHFSLTQDKAGFAGSNNIVDSTYDLLPLIKDAVSRQPKLKILGSPWTAPAWMKDNNDWYTHWSRGGSLLAQYYGTYANYLVKYIQACNSEGIYIWGLTPENEPDGNGGNWESMEMNGGSEASFIKNNLGPALAANGLNWVKILAYDQNREGELLNYINTFFADSAAVSYIYGTAVHWYGSTTNVDTGNLDYVHGLNPGKALMHTEGCVDQAANSANMTGGVFSGWQTGDAWWWTVGARDWASGDPMHPPYAPVHRYARDIIEGLNHWFTGWIDWNIVLDKNGGPNHVGNFCGAPIMVDTSAKTAYFTPLYFVMSQFSKYIRPGDRVATVNTTGKSKWDDFHATAVVSPDKKRMTVVMQNTTSGSLNYNIKIGGQIASASIPANSVQTVVIVTQTNF